MREKKKYTFRRGSSPPFEKNSPSYGTGIMGWRRKWNEGMPRGRGGWGGKKKRRTEEEDILNDSKQVTSIGEKGYSRVARLQRDMEKGGAGTL